MNNLEKRLFETMEDYKKNQYLGFFKVDTEQCFLSFKQYCSIMENLKKYDN